MDLIEYSIRESSLGYIILIARNGRLIKLGIKEGDPLFIRKNIAITYPFSKDSEKPFTHIWKDLDSYLRGNDVQFNAEMDISGLTPFVRDVLCELMKIPYGELRSYAWIGERLGYRDASRAVGQAVGKNPIPIIIPCHRVIRQDGAMGGFSSGVHIKKMLLSIEGSISRIKRF